MADFQHHLFYGISMSAVTAGAGYLQFDLNIPQAGAAFIMGSLTSLAPDLDHPEGLPGKILFETLGVLIPISFLPYFPAEYKQQFFLEHWIIYFVIFYLLIRFGVAYLFTKMMTHRGIFHSLPAVIIVAEVIFLWFQHIELQQRITISVIAAIGYLTHLIADEVYSVDWNGMEVKRSLGSALDIGHISEFSTWFAYALLIGLGKIILWDLGVL